LTGKYLKEDKDARMNASTFPEIFKNVVHFNEWFGEKNIENTRKIFHEFEEIAKSLGGTIA